jgi:hypothetical protein
MEFAANDGKVRHFYIEAGQETEEFFRTPLFNYRLITA